MIVKSEQEFYGGYGLMNFSEKQDLSLQKENSQVKSDSYQWSENIDNNLQGKKSTVNLPTKGYIDKVIAQAVTNIKNGENVAENRRILNIFSNLAGENPITTERKAYI